MRISDWSSDVCSSDLLLEQFVAGLVAERVVDRLEAIEIEQEQRGRAIGATRLGESLIERPLHLLEVGEPGQLVEARPSVDLWVRTEILGQVVARTDAAHGYDGTGGDGGAGDAQNK